MRFRFPGIFIRESSSRIYSTYVFAIAQLLGEVPYSILCAIVYWVLMVSISFDLFGICHLIFMFRFSIGVSNGLW